jgi:hypothetical protein
MLLLRKADESEGVSKIVAAGMAWSRVLRFMAGILAGASIVVVANHF